MSAVYNDFWCRFAEHHNAVVIIHGMEHRLKYSEYKAIYPYECWKVDLHAEPVDKTTPYYCSTRNYLGDDWAIDLTASTDIDLYNILEQLGELV